MRGHYIKALDKSFLEKLERKAEEDIKSQMINTIKYVQEEFGADIFHFNIEIKQTGLNKWLEVKDDWSRLFKKVEPIVNVKAEIRHIGTIK